MIHVDPSPFGNTILVALVMMRKMILLDSNKIVSFRIGKV